MLHLKVFCAPGIGGVVGEWVAVGNGERAAATGVGRHSSGLVRSYQMVTLLGRDRTVARRLIIGPRGASGRWERRFAYLAVLFLFSVR
jgi:hypothetical protein